MVVINRELYLWAINGWSVFPDRSSGCSFSIWVSQKFLEAAKETIFDENSIQAKAREIIKWAGFKHVENHPSFLRFGEWGLMNFDVPGNACGLDMEFGGVHDLKRGVRFVPHNVDTPLQQATLMAIWLMWANVIELEILQRKTQGGRLNGKNLAES